MKGVSEVNTKACIFYALIAFGIIVVVLWYFNVYEIGTKLNGAVAWVAAKIPSLGLGNFDIGAFIQKNLATIVTLGPALIAAVISWFRLRAEQKINTNLVTENQQLGTKLISLEGSKTTTQATIKELEDKITALEAADPAVESLQTRLSSLITEKTSLASQLEAQKSQYAYTWQQLAHGATEIKNVDTGEIIKMVEKVVYR